MEDWYDGFGLLRRDIFKPRQGVSGVQNTKESGSHISWDRSNGSKLCELEK